MDPIGSYLKSLETAYSLSQSARCFDHISDVWDPHSDVWELLFLWVSFST